MRSWVSMSSPCERVGPVNPQRRIVLSHREIGRSLACFLISGHVSAGIKNFLGGIFSGCGNLGDIVQIQVLLLQPEPTNIAASRVPIPGLLGNLS